MIGETPKMTRRDARNYVLFPAIGGALLGLALHTVCIEIPERMQEQQGKTSEFVMETETLFDTLASQND